MSGKPAKNYIVLILLLGCGLLFACAGCGKSKGTKGEKKEFEIDKPYERGPLSVHVCLNKSKITIAETVLLQLEAAIDPNYELKMPQVGEKLENFGIVDWDRLPDKLDDKNNIVRTYQYRIEPFLSGTYAIPAFTFEFHDANNVEGKKYELVTEPIDVEITSLLGEQRDKLVVADIEDVVGMPEEASYWWIWIISAAGVVVAAAVWLYLRRKRYAELVRILKPAHELAYEYLRALVKEDLVNKGRVKEFYERISDILRHYIEHRFSLKAPERTTEEFLAELQFTDALAASDKEALGEFLNHCDLVKFAKMNPTNEQIQRTFDLVKDFIEKTKSDERKIDVTDMAGNREVVEIGSM